MKKILAIMLICVMMFFVVGCGLTPIDPSSLMGNSSQLNPSVDESERPNNSGGLLGLFSKNDENEKIEPKFKMCLGLVSPLNSWDKTRLNNMQSIAAKDNIGFYNMNLEKLNMQVEYIRNVIKNENVGLLVLSPMYIQDTNWSQILKQLDLSKIKVIAIDNLTTVGTDAIDAVLSQDFDAQAKLAAEWINKNVKDAKIVVIEEAFNYKSETLQKSFENAVDGNILSVEVSDGSRQSASDVTSSLLENDETKNASVIFAHNDDIAIGAIEAIKNSDKKLGKDIHVVSLGSSKVALLRLKAGEISAVVKSDPVAFADELMKLATNVVEDKPFEKENYLPSELIEKDGAVKALRESSY